MKIASFFLIIIFLLALVGAIYIYNNAKAIIEGTANSAKQKYENFERSGYFLQQLQMHGDGLTHLN